MPKTDRRDPVTASQIMSCESCEPDAKRIPSLEKDKHVTPSECPFVVSSRRTSPVPESIRCT